MTHPKQIAIRPFGINDYEAAVQLWSGLDGLKVNESNTLGALQAFTDRVPKMSAVAIDESDDMIGAVLGGQNGRAGSLYHLTVAQR